MRLAVVSCDSVSANAVCLYESVIVVACGA
jgi:hypothetical protein